MIAQPSEIRLLTFANPRYIAEEFSPLFVNTAELRDSSRVVEEQKRRVLKVVQVSLGGTGPILAHGIWSEICVRGRSVIFVVLFRSDY